MTSKAILVIGMHRSGTSALTGVLRLLGVDLGENLLPANEANVRGYWEHADIYDVHERLLATLGTAWADPLPLLDDWWEQEDVEPFRQELRSIIRRDFAQSDCWAVKDPRLWKLLPLWKDLLAELDVSPAVIIPVRNPAEIVGSLGVRDQFGSGRTYRLWLNHVLCTEAKTRDCPRVFTTYDQLLADWRITIGRIADALDIHWPRRPDDMADQIGEFLSSDLRHHNVHEAPEQKVQGMPSLAESTYSHLLQAAVDDNPKLRQRFSMAHRRLLEANELMSGLEEENRELHAHSEELEQEMDSHKESALRLGEETQQLSKLLAGLNRDLALEKKQNRKLEVYSKGLENDLSQLRDHSGELEEYCRSLERDFLELRDQSERLQEYSKRLETDLQRHAEEEEEHRTYSRNLEKELSQLKGHGEEVESYVRGLESELSQHLTHVKELGGYTAKLETELEALRSTAEKLGGKAAASKLEERKLRRTISQLHAELTRLEATVTEFRASKSWRVTRPLRRIALAARRLGGTS